MKHTSLFSFLPKEAWVYWSAVWQNLYQREEGQWSKWQIENILRHDDIVGDKLFHSFFAH